MKRLGRILAGLADEQHASEKLAGRWHVAHAVCYVGLIGLYVGATVWHAAAAKRHFRDAAAKLPHEAKRG